MALNLTMRTFLTLLDYVEQSTAISDLSDKKHMEGIVEDMRKQRIYKKNESDDAMRLDNAINEIDKYIETLE
jgi:hypothetical protein